MAEMWSDYTDVVITNIDRNIGNKYKLSVREFLSNPLKYATRQNISATATSMQKDADDFLDTLLDGLKEEKKMLTDSAAKADSITAQLTQNISMQAKQNKVPIVKPVLIERDQVRDEIIYVDAVDAALLSLIERFVSSSKYIADYTGTYEDYRIGEWTFAGDKNYVLRVYLPRTETALIENSKGEIDTLFDAAAGVIKSLP